MNHLRLLFAFVLLVTAASSREASAQVLNKQKQLEAQTFWDNRDWTNKRCQEPNSGVFPETVR
jgi:hypothetical protein